MWNTRNCGGTDGLREPGAWTLEHAAGTIRESIQHAAPVNLEEIGELM